MEIKIQISDAVYAQLLHEQFDLFIKNMGVDENTLDDIYNDSLFIFICKAVAKEFESCNMRQDAYEVQEILRKLSK